MPELPEVQTTANGLDKRVRGLKIVDVWTDYNSIFHKGKDSIKDPAFFAHFKKEVVGTTITHVSRRAKNVLIHTESAIILVHMKMTGHILYAPFELVTKPHPTWIPAKNAASAFRDPFNRFIHFVITLSNGKHIALSDMRKFAKVTLVPATYESKHLDGIGPEPLDPHFNFEMFKKRLALRPTGRIKTVLMDQTIIAGIGNIYSDEALWRAGIHPEEQVKNLLDDDILLKKLFEASLTVLKNGIDFGGDSMSDYRNIDGERGRFQEQHRAYRKTGTPCSKHDCTGTITRKVVGGRSAHFCSVHQRLQKGRSPQKQRH